MMAKTFQEQAEINIGMIGHVDHGKTSLTQALSGKWTDTHSEELKRGISIRLGYADATFYRCDKCKGSEAYTSHEKCPNCGGKAKKLRKVSFVDAPGHETLMTTMLSGAALMQGAVLVIAANEDCPQPRTVEHLMALSISGVKNIVVAQNKADLVDRDAAIKNQAKIRKFLEEYGYKDAPIIPTSAPFGTNIDMLIEAIEEHIPSPKIDPKKELRMYVARSFDVNRPGAKIKEMKGGVLGGSIMQGSLKVGEEIEFGPGFGGKKMATKCVSLGTAEGELDKAGPGGLIAIGTELDPLLTRNDQLRGHVVGKKGTLPEATTDVRLDVKPFRRVVEKETEIKVNETVVLTIGTMTTIGTVVKSAGGKLKIASKIPVIVERGQTVAVSKKINAQWRLAAYGVAV